ncbi:MAG: hypothetical protein LBC78_02400 [Oscillospiraceae bacterium]|jgi:hypothetical protein|nr:hypothetical protein [Oscillospiraceae bacterium]
MMKKQYEVTREIFNKCSGNQMRDVFFEEAEVDSNELQQYAMQYAKGKDVMCERFDGTPGVVIFELNVDGLKQKITFCEA